MLKNNFSYIQIYEKGDKSADKMKFIEVRNWFFQQIQCNFKKKSFVYSFSEKFYLWKVGMQRWEIIMIIIIIKFSFIADRLII